jgi:hypothetical protein
VAWPSWSSPWSGRPHARCCRAVPVLSVVGSSPCSSWSGHPRTHHCRANSRRGRPSVHRTEATLVLLIISDGTEDGGGTRPPRSLRRDGRWRRHPSAGPALYLPSRPLHLNGGCSQDAATQRCICSAGVPRPCICPDDVSGPCICSADVRRPCICAV